MHIEEGKFYKTRDGRKVGPMRTSDTSPFHKWTAAGEGLSWGDNGQGISSGIPVSSDLIAEWTDAPQYETGRWYPWTGGECPVPYNAEVSLMFSGGVVLDHGDIPAGPWVWKQMQGMHTIIAFRVDAYPEQEERVYCMRYGLGDPVEEGTCTKRGGVIDWSTWEDK